MEGAGTKTETNNKNTIKEVTIGQACDPRPQPGWGLESPWCSFPEPPNPLPQPQGQPGAVPPQVPSSVFQPTHEAEYMQYPSVCLGRTQLWGVPAVEGTQLARTKSVISVFLFWFYCL